MVMVDLVALTVQIIITAQLAVLVAHTVAVVAVLDLHMLDIVRQVQVVVVAPVLFGVQDVHIQTQYQTLLQSANVCICSRSGYPSQLIAGREKHILS
jgi:hypothetical protein